MKCEAVGDAGFVPHLTLHEAETWVLANCRELKKNVLNIDKGAIVAFAGRQRSRPTRCTPSAELVNAAYRFLSVDEWMIIVLLVGGLVDLAVIAAVPVPSILLGASSSNAGPFDWINVLTLACALWVSTSVTVVVTGAATATVLIRVDDGVRTARAALAIVRSRRRPLTAWALVSAVVGVVFILLSRAGIAGVVAQLAATIGWTAATMFAIPIVISHGTMPAATVRQSARMVRANFGTVTRGGIKRAAPWIVAGVGAVLEAIASSFVLLAADAHPNGILVLGRPVLLGRRSPVLRRSRQCGIRGLPQHDSVPFCRWPAHSGPRPGAPLDAERCFVAGGSLQAGIAGHSLWDTRGPALKCRPGRARTVSFARSESLAPPGSNSSPSATG
jgi:hypothetical protein